MNGTFGNASSQFPIQTTTYWGPNPNNICCSFIPSVKNSMPFDCPSTAHNRFAGDGVGKNQRIVAAVHIQPSHFWATLPVKALNVIKCVPYSVVIVKWSVLICKEPKLTSANSRNFGKGLRVAVLGSQECLARGTQVGSQFGFEASVETICSALQPSCGDIWTEVGPQADPLMIS